MEGRRSVPARARMRKVHGLRFRRAPLAQKDRHHDEEEDREELALPVLERFEQELGVGEHVVDARRVPVVWATKAARAATCPASESAKHSASAPPKDVE